MSIRFIDRHWWKPPFLPQFVYQGFGNPSPRAHIPPKAEIAFQNFNVTSVAALGEKDGEKFCLANPSRHEIFVRGCGERSNPLPHGLSGSNMSRQTERIRHLL